LGWSNSHDKKVLTIYHCRKNHGIASEVLAVSAADEWILSSNRLCSPPDKKQKLLMYATVSQKGVQVRAFWTAFWTIFQD
jgi:hypothetical protein